MTSPLDHWLLDPVFPALPALPRLDGELAELADLDAEPAASTQYPSGTWRLGLRVEDEEAADADDERRRTSTSDAPTVRPGSLHALKAG